tara:strand:- start:1092 stop:1331 length:240 start_codon:yes stop_codon:yes gene_type:complete
MCYNASHKQNEKRISNGFIDNDSHVACGRKLCGDWHGCDYGREYLGGVFCSRYIRMRSGFVRASTRWQRLNENDSHLGE